MTLSRSPSTPRCCACGVRAGQRIVDLQLELHRKASHDDLTGMFNRRMVVEMLAREHARVVREKGVLSLGLLDIDYFKRVNDSFGHHAGDAVLQEVARRINASVRKIDIDGPLRRRGIPVRAAWLRWEDDAARSPNASA